MTGPTVAAFKAARQRRLKWRFAAGVGVALGSAFLALAFLAALSADLGVSGVGHRRALTGLVVAAGIGAAGAGVALGAARELRHAVLETAPLAGGILLSVPAAFAVWAVATAVAHTVIR